MSFSISEKLDLKFSGTLGGKRLFKVKWNISYSPLVGSSPSSVVVAFLVLVINPALGGCWKYLPLVKERKKGRVVFVQNPRKQDMFIPSSKDY